MFSTIPRRSDEELDFGFPGFHPMMVPRPLPLALYSDRQSKDVEVHNTDTEFRLRLNLMHFTPEEVNIKSEDGKIVVTAKHEEKQAPHGFAKRNY